MSSLDSTDPYANIWNDHLSQITTQSSLKQQQLSWRGQHSSRGKGGRGVSRTTIQPNDVILSNVTLEYISDEISGCVGSKILLSDAKLKLLSSRTSSSSDGDGDGDTNQCQKGKVYALVGRNGCGKSTLLRRMDAKKIPGFINLHLKSMYIPQEVFEDDYGLLSTASSSTNDYDNDDDNDEEEGLPCDDENSKNHDVITPMDVVLRYTNKNKKESKYMSQNRIQQLEEQLEIIMNSSTGTSSSNDDDEMERICNEIALLEDASSDAQKNDNDKDDDNNDEMIDRASQVLSYFGIDESKQRTTSMTLLSGGLKKKVLLACALFCDIDILLLDGKYTN